MRLEHQYSRPTVDGEIEPYACAEVDLDCLALVHRELIELDKRRIPYNATAAAIEAEE